MQTTARTRLLRTLPGVAALAALPLTSCAPDEDPAEFEDAEAASQTEERAQDEGEDPAETEKPGDHVSAADEESAGEGETTDSDEDTPEASQAGENAAPDLGDAEQTVTVPTFEPGMGEVTVDVYPLEVEEDVMRLRLAFTPDLDSESSIRTDQMFDTVGPGNLMLPTLNDRQNLKEYSILGASGMTNSGWSTGGQEVGDGDTAYYWAYYSAPEDDIDSINIAVTKGMPEFDDVSIDWGDASPSDSEGDE